MASFTLLLLHLLLLVSAGSAWSNNYRSFGASLNFTPKGQNSDRTYNTQQTKLNSNLPFEIRYPTRLDSYHGYGYWIPNFRSSWSRWRMTAHVDLGTRSDTGEANKSPITTILPTLRVPRNCPRSFKITAFDPDGDRVRCRLSNASPECGVCVLAREFSFDQDSCSLQYRSGAPAGYYPIELMVEDYPRSPITLSYSDGSYTVKSPLSVGRQKREAWSFSTTPASTTPEPTPIDQSTIAPTTPEPTPIDQSTIAPTAPEPTPVDHTTIAPTTPEPTPIDQTTIAPTTAEPTPIDQTTIAPTTPEPTQIYQTTAAPTTTVPPTTLPTTLATTTLPYRTTVAPLSKLPLQFSVYVDSHLAPSCLDGDYFPVFVAPTPRNGVNLPAFVNQTLKIRVKSKAQYTKYLMTD